MQDPIIKLHVLARSEKALLKIHARRLVTRIALLAVALIFGLLAVGMINFSGYQALAVTQGPAVAALIVAAVNGILCVIIAAGARRAGNDKEQETILQEIRDLAYKELNADFKEAKSELEQISSELKSIRSGLGDLTSGAGSMFSSIVPLVNMFLEAFKNWKTK